jgi:hypothetical protein
VPTIVVCDASFKGVLTCETRDVYALFLGFDARMVRVGKLFLNAGGHGGGSGGCGLRLTRWRAGRKRVVEGP